MVTWIENWILTQMVTWVEVFTDSTVESSTVQCKAKQNSAVQAIQNSTAQAIQNNAVHSSTVQCSPKLDLYSRMIALIL